MSESNHFTYDSGYYTFKRYFSKGSDESVTIVTEFTGMPDEMLIHELKLRGVIKEGE